MVEACGSPLPLPPAPAKAGRLAGGTGPRPSRDFSAALREFSSQAGLPRGRPERRAHAVIANFREGTHPLSSVRRRHGLPGAPRIRS